MLYHNYLPEFFFQTCPAAFNKNSTNGLVCKTSVFIQNDETFTFRPCHAIKQLF